MFVARGNPTTASVNIVEVKDEGSEGKKVTDDGNYKIYFQS